MDLGIQNRKSKIQNRVSATLAGSLRAARCRAVTLGGLAMFYQAFQQGLRLMRSLLDNTGQLYYNSLFLGNLFEFLALEPKLLDSPAPVRVPTCGMYSPGCAA